MRLWHNPASPFARKVRVVARELHLTQALEEISVLVSPVNPNQTLAKVNPLVKIPTLQTDDGVVLYDSSVICEYLEHTYGQHHLIPNGAQRWQTLRLQSLCDGVLDAAVLCRYELAVRPEAYRWDAWVEGQFFKINNGLTVLNQSVSDFGESFQLGHISVACVLGYLDFRFADHAWREKQPALAKWYETIKGRDSLTSTLPS